MSSIDSQIESYLSSLKLEVGSIVQGHVVDVNRDFVKVDVGGKSEGLVPLSEFRDGKVAKDSDITVMIESLDDGYGATVLSHEKALRHAAWLQLEESFQKKETITGVVLERVKGGFTVRVSDLKAFLPGSLADLRGDEGDTLEGQTIEIKLVKMDKTRNNIVVSRRAVLEAESNVDREALLASIKEGIELKGIVKNLTDYGAFIDLGGIDGLLHITDMSWKRIKHPSDLVKVRDEITVKVLSFDAEKQRVSLGLKQLSGDPWKNLVERYPEGKRLFGKVSNVTDYGCFVEIEEGVEGLVHISEMDWTNKNINPNTLVKNGDEIEVMVLEIDEKRRRISLGIKQCTPNPWEDFSNNHKVDDKVAGNIKSITDFGVFIGLDGGIDGLVHYTDLSWTEPGEKAIRNYKKGDHVEAVILAIDPERERISLGVKQLEEDPIELYLDAHPVATEVTGTVASVDSKRILIQLDDKISGSIRAGDFETEPKEGESVTAYIQQTAERKGYYVLLVLNKAEANKAFKSAKVKTEGDEYDSDQPVQSTLGDLLQGQLGDDK